MNYIVSKQSISLDIYEIDILFPKLSIFFRYFDNEIKSLASGYQSSTFQVKMRDFQFQLLAFSALIGSVLCERIVTLPGLGDLKSQVST
jgi:hypothetical protein